MTKEQLISLGFKKVKYGENYWFEKKHKNHVFVTNDDLFNKGKDNWCVGYASKKDKSGNVEWFNNEIKSLERFACLYAGITGGFH